ncbi:MAG: hypothetical protein R8K47_01960, partial [Mariprofundaceae bacterium]
MEHQTQSNLQSAQGRVQQYRTLDIRHDREHALAWYYMHATPRQCCTPRLVHEIQQWFGELR